MKVSIKLTLLYRPGGGNTGIKTSEDFLSLSFVIEKLLVEFLNYFNVGWINYQIKRRLGKYQKEKYPALPATLGTVKL